MQKYKITEIGVDQVIPTAEKMRKDGVILTMIHGYYNTKNQPVVAYEYQIDDGIESYQVVGEKVLPTISEIYSFAAEWPELEIMEMMDVKFEGLKFKRLFLPENTFDDKGQILITPMEELIAKTHGEKENQE